MSEETDPSNFPEIEESGTDGTQTVRSGEILLPSDVSPAIGNAGLASAFREINEDSPRGLNQQSAKLIYGSYEDLRSEKAELKSELVSARHVLSNANSEIAGLKVDLERLRIERDSAKIDARRIAGLGVLASVLLGASATLYPGLEAWVLGGVGFVLLLLSLFWAKSGGVSSK